MKRLIILALLFFVVVALSPLLVDEKGYILIAVGNKTLESSLLSAIIMLTLLGFVALIVLKLIRGGWRISLSGWNKVIFANRRGAIKNLHKGVTAYILGDYQQAEQLLAKSAEPSQLSQLAYLMAASAASKQSLVSNTDHYLALLDDEIAFKSAGLDAIIVKISLLLEQQAYVQARQLVDQYHKHIGHDARLLTCSLDLTLAEKNYPAAIEHLVAARKQKSICDARIEQWEKIAFYGAFNAALNAALNAGTRQGDQKALSDYWQALPRKLKQREVVLFAYCQVLAEQNIVTPLTALLLPALKKDPSEAFLRRLQGLQIKHADELIMQVQKQLHNNHQSAKWLSCLGHLGLSSGQWQMAEKAFNSLIKLEPVQYRQADLHAFAQALTEQGKHQEANQVWHRALTLG